MAAVLFVLTILIYLPSINGDVLWDDTGHVTKPELRSIEGLRRIWFVVGASQQYYPMLHTAFWLEHRVWGDSTLGYHLTNILFHATSACLLALVLTRLCRPQIRGFNTGNATALPLGREGPPAQRIGPQNSGRGGGQAEASAKIRSLATARAIGLPPDRETGPEPSGPSGGPAEALVKAGPALPWVWVAAFLFAVHPVCVESVAWISEQKNTLSGAFYLLAALAFLHFHDKIQNQVGPERKRAGWFSLRRAIGHCARYLLASVLFFLALMSKTVTATLPAALLVALWWRQGRLSFRRDVTPLIPWIGLGAIFGLFTAWVERNVVGAEGGSYELSLLERCLLASRAIWFYLAKLTWPADLIFVYPHWKIDAHAWWQFLFLAGIVALLILLWLPIRRVNSPGTRAPLAGFLIYCGTLFPVLGFFNVYPFRFSYVADHFQYLASIGIITLIAAGWGRWAASNRLLPAFPRLPVAVAGAGLCLLAVLSWRQSHMYRNDEVLYRTTLARNAGSWMAENNLGTILSKTPARVPEAIEHYKSALRLKPDYPEGYNNLGSVYSKMPGRLDEAIALMEESLRLNPSYADAQNNLGLALAQAHRLGEAEAHFREAIRLKPDYPEAHNDLGITLGEKGQLDAAMMEFNEAIRLRPDYPAVHKNLGLALAMAGRLPEAISQFEEFFRLDPNDPEAQKIMAAIRAHAPSFNRQ